MIIMETSMGTMKIELHEDKAPITCENFLGYVRDGFYDGTIFHRVIPNFVLQGGGMTEAMREKKTGKPIKNEADNGLKNLRGTLSMARTQAVDSATSQFFINLRDNAFLDHGARDFGYASSRASRSWTPSPPCPRATTAFIRTCPRSPCSSPA